MGQWELVETLLQQNPDKWFSISMIKESTNLPRPTIRRILSERVTAGIYKRKETDGIKSTIRFKWIPEDKRRQTIPATS